jgi:hypothetical protein
MEATINILELASELADSHTVQKFAETKGCSVKKFLELYYNEVYVEGEWCISYTDEAQDVFNEYYDFYLDFIERVVKK